MTITTLTDKYLANISHAINELFAHVVLRLQFDDLTAQELDEIERALDEMADILSNLASGEWPKAPALSRSPDRKQDS